MRRRVRLGSGRSSARVKTADPVTLPSGVPETTEPSPSTGSYCREQQSSSTSSSRHGAPAGRSGSSSSLNSPRAQSRPQARLRSWTAIADVAVKHAQPFRRRRRHRVGEKFCTPIGSDERGDLPRWAGRRSRGLVWATVTIDCHQAPGSWARSAQARRESHSPEYDPSELSYDRTRTPRSRQRTWTSSSVPLSKAKIFAGVLSVRARSPLQQIANGRIAGRVSQQHDYITLQ